MTAPIRRLALIVALLAPAGCGDAEPPAPTPQGALALHVNGVAVKQIPAADLAQRVALTALLPEEARDPQSWRLVEAFGLSRHLRVPDPAQTYRDQDWMTYLDEQGRPSLGVFRRDRPELSSAVRRMIREPTVALVGAAEVRVWTVPPPVPAAGTGAWDIVLVVNGTETRLDGKALSGLTRVGAGEPAQGGTGGGRKKGRQRGRSKEGGQGWHLADVLGLRTEGRALTAAVVHGGGDATVAVSGEALAARAGPVPVLKRNNRGQLVFRMVDASTGEAVGGTLRGITRIDVTVD